MAFANKLKELLLANQMKAVDLSRETGLSEGVISEYLSGKKEPRGKQSICIARALHVSLDELWETGFDSSSESNKALRENKNLNIAKKLKEARKRSGLPMPVILEKLASLGKEISGNTIYSYETGHRQPDADTLMLLCEVYGIQDVLGEFGYSTIAPAELPGLSQEEAELIKYFRLFSQYEQAAFLHFASRIAPETNQQPIETAEAERERIAEEMARDVEKYVAESRRSQLLHREAAE